MNNKIIGVLDSIASCLDEGNSVNLYFFDGREETINSADVDINCFIRNLYENDTLANCYVDMKYKKQRYTNKDIEDILF